MAEDSVGADARHRNEGHPDWACSTSLDQYQAKLGRNVSTQPQGDIIFDFKFLTYSTVAGKSMCYGLNSTATSLLALFTGMSLPPSQLGRTRY